MENIFTVSSLSEVIKKMNRGKLVEILLNKESGLTETQLYNSHVGLDFFTSLLTGEDREPILLINREYYKLANKIAKGINDTLIIEALVKREKDWGCYPASVTKGYKSIKAFSSYMPKGWAYKLDTELQVNGNSETDLEFRTRAIIALVIKVLEALRFEKSLTRLI